MTDDRVAILSRVREALRVPAPKLYERDHHAPTGAVSLPMFDPRPWLPPVGATRQEQIELFARNSLELKTAFILVESVDGANAALSQLAREQGWKSMASHNGSLVRGLVNALPLTCMMTDGGYNTADLEKVDAGISECDALVAQTGSVVLTARSAGGRALSVLPPHHVVIATIDQLLPDLPAAYAMLGSKYAANLPSMMTVITGPSRTGDIERTIVLGAHGPKQLTVILIDV